MPGWIIDTDHLYEVGDPVIAGHKFGEIANSYPKRFRVKDDDGQIYYEGRCSHESFAPLRWATSYAGATSIEYRYGNSWQQL